jgi:hypothetical protein
MYVFQRGSKAPLSVRFGVRSRNLSNVGQSLVVWPNIYYLELLCASDGTLSRWYRLHMQSLAPTNQHWARVVGFGPFSLCIIRKEGLCPSSGNINRLMHTYIHTYHSRLITCFQSYIQFSCFLTESNCEVKCEKTGLFSKFPDNLVKVLKA